VGFDDAAVLDRSDLGALFDALRADGFRTIGPRLRAGAVVYADVAGEADLPAGWGARQEAGTYRLEPRRDDAVFGHGVAAQSWKPYLLPPEETLLTVSGTGGELHFTGVQPQARPLAFVGVRACDLAAIAILDDVFLGGRYRDPRYAARRRGLFIAAVNCTEPGATCFCASMGTGPEVASGADLTLTEMVDDAGHWFLVAAGTPAGDDVLARLPTSPATEAQLGRCRTSLDGATAAMARSLDTAGLRDLLSSRPDHPRWEQTGRRCLACANCTQVCPTCFCTTVVDGSFLDAQEATRSRRWDSCFSLEFSSLHGHPVRAGVAARYRQWLTHKLAGWIDQFGVSGCVGCGRCITWCPVGIDLTEEVDAIRVSTEVCS
jgi:ferredoxin